MTEGIGDTVLQAIVEAVSPRDLLRALHPALENCGPVRWILGITVPGATAVSLEGRDQLPPGWGARVVEGRLSSRPEIQELLRAGKPATLELPGAEHASGGEPEAIGRLFVHLVPIVHREETLGFLAGLSESMLSTSPDHVILRVAGGVLASLRIQAVLKTRIRFQHILREATLALRAGGREGTALRIVGAGLDLASAHIQADPLLALDWSRSPRSEGIAAPPPSRVREGTYAPDEGWLAVQDSEALPPNSDLAVWMRALGARAYLRVPLVPGTDACLALVSASPRRWKSEELVLVRSFVDELALLLMRLQSEQDLLQSEARHRELARRLSFFIEEMPLGCVVWSEAGAVDHWNRAAARIFGYPLGDPPEGLSIGDILPGLASGPDAADLPPGAGQELPGRTREGEEMRCQCHHTPILDETGRRVARITMIQDLTQKILLERQLQHAQKMETIGTLVAGFSHDFNNQLMAVLGNINLVAAHLSPHHADGRRLADAARAANRCVEMTRSLLTFARRVPGERKPVDLVDVVEETGRLAAQLVPDRIRISGPPSEALPMAWCDPSHVQQILLNLIVNARDAITGEGTIRLLVDGGHPSRSGQDGARRYLRIQVADDGEGMSEEVRARIFDPFFTTRDPGKGSGLGLAMVYGLARAGDGWVEVESSPGGGSTFSVFIPEAGATAADPAMPSPPPARAGAVSRRRILVVDDEQAVRELTGVMLGMLGYAAIPARDGAEALERLGQEESIDLVLMDWSMPGVSGNELLVRIAEIRPDLPVLVCSGYFTDSDAIAQARSRVFSLGKPYDVDQLGQALLAALGGGGGGSDDPLGIQEAHRRG